MVKRRSCWPDICGKLTPAPRLIFSSSSSKTQLHDYRNSAINTARRDDETSASIEIGNAEGLAGDGPTAAAGDVLQAKLLDMFADFPRTGRLAGIDYGTVRMGVATCDPTQNWVTPFDTYTRRNEKLDAKFLRELAQTEHIVGWVVGLPIHCDGNESQKSGEVRKFAVWLEELSGLPVALFDERFSTAEARRLLRDTGLSPQKRKQNLDRLAAHLILSHFVEARRSNQSPSRELF